jgi:glycosyltransferase involved in cell wall biosynthesis
MHDEMLNVDPTSRLKIVHVIPFFVPEGVGGAQHIVNDLAVESSQRHDVSVITWSGLCVDSEPKVEERGAFTVHWLGSLPRINHVTVSETPEIDDSFKRVIETIVPDVVHLHQLSGVSANLIGISKGCARVVVVTLHDYLNICPTDTIDFNGKLCFQPGFKCFSCLNPDMFSRRRLLGYWRLTNPIMVLFGRICGRSMRLGRLVEALSTRKKIYFDALKNADALIAPSKALANVYLEAGIAAESIYVIPHGIKAPQRSFGLRDCQDKLRFGFIGNHRVKGLTLLLRAFSQLDTKDAELLLYTDLRSYPPDVGREAARLTADPRVRILERFSPDEADDVYGSFDVLVAPSIWVEPFGLVAAEAVIRGVPVIASNSSGFEEVVNDGVNGLLFRRGDVQSLKLAMQRLVYDRRLVKELQVNCGVAKTIDRYAIEVEGLYWTCLEKRTMRQISNDPVPRSAL